MKRLLFASGAMAILLGASACTEKLTTSGECPTLCPGGQALIRDTVIDAVVGADSSFSGYVAPADLLSILMANGGAFGESRAIIRFFPRGDSVLVSDTNRAFVTDSITIELGVQARDTSISDFAIEVFKLPRNVDTLSSLAEIDALMTPSTLLGEIPVTDPTFRAGLVHLRLPGNGIVFTPGDSTRLMLGLRIRSGTPTGARIGTAASGSMGPQITYWTTANVADTSRRSQPIIRTGDRSFTIRPVGTPPSPELLAVGGDPVSRSFVRFNLPLGIRDSAMILRATLELTMQAPIFGVPFDTASLQVRSVLADFGAKSPIAAPVASTFLLPGNTSASVEVASLVQLWQGRNGLPPVIRLSLGQEGGSFLQPLFNSTHSQSGPPPKLRITYRLPFGFEGY